MMWSAEEFSKYPSCKRISFKKGHFEKLIVLFSLKIILLWKLVSTLFFIIELTYKNKHFEMLFLNRVKL